MTRARKPTGVALAGAAAAVLVACGANAAKPPDAATPSQSAGQSPDASTSAPATTDDGCLRGTLLVRYPGADNPLRTSCVHTGTEIVITLTAKRPYRWDPVTSSDPAVITRVGSSTAKDGALVTTLRALHPGTSTLTSADTFAPDPHGPPSKGWSLAVSVTP